MSNSKKSRVGAGAAERKRDRYTERMNACHPPRLGRDAMDAKYLNDPLFDKVMSLSHHLSEHYGDHTVNEIRTLVNMAANDPDHPMLQKYWDEIDGVVPVASSDVEPVLTSDIGSGAAVDFVASSFDEECVVDDSREIAGPSDRVAQDVVSGSSLNQSYGHGEATSPLLAGDGELFTIEMAREVVTAMSQDHAVTSANDVILDINQDDLSTVPVPPPRRTRTRAVESVKLDLVDRSAAEVMVWNNVVDLSHFIPPINDDRSNENPPHVRLNMHGRKRIIAEVQPAALGWCGALRSFLDRETHCSMLSLRVCVCVAGLVLVCMCGVSTSL